MDKKNGRKPRLDISTIVYGRVPPQALDIEEAVLGAIMLQKDTFEVAALVLNEECFYTPGHQKIFKAMQIIAARSQPIDMLTVKDQLDRMGELDNCGGHYYLTKLTTSIVSGANIERHSKIVYEKYLQRECIRIAAEMLTDSYDPASDAFELVDDAEKKLFSITNKINGSRGEDVTGLLVKQIREIYFRADEAAKGDNYLSGVPTGFKEVNRLTHGWQPTDLIILAARPSMGKTALALSLARNAASDPYKPTAVAIFSLEMSSGQLIERLLSSVSGVPLEKIKKGRLEEHDRKALHEAMKKISTMKIHIDDTPSLNIFELRAKVRRLKSSHNIGLVLIDYLQLMSGIGDKNREQDISGISRGLKHLAKEVTIPVIALSQLSRQAEQRSEKHKMPQLSDLRESGAIEQDADVVCFMYRPEYYNLGEDRSVGETIVRFAKNRNGTCENITLTAQLWIQNFVDFNGGLGSPLYNGTGLDFKKLQSGERSGHVSTSQLADKDDEDPF